MWVELSQAIRNRLMRPVNGKGGFQTLLRKLRGQLNGDWVLVTPEDAERLSRYSYAYGGGGFQRRTSPVAQGVQGTLAFD